MASKKTKRKQRRVQQTNQSFMLKNGLDIFNGTSKRCMRKTYIHGFFSSLKLCFMMFIILFFLLPSNFIIGCYCRYTEQTSQPIFLDQCRIYQLEIFGRDKWGYDHISVGMRKPSGGYERPITGTRLFWTKPGNGFAFNFFFNCDMIIHLSTITVYDRKIIKRKLLKSI